MTFKINQAALLSALNIAGKAVGTNNVIPILENFHLQSKDDHLTVEGNNLQVDVATTIPCNGDDVNICVYGPRIIGIIKDLPNQELTFTVTDALLTIKSSTGKYSMPTERGEDFPTFPAITGEPLTLPADELIGLIDKVLFAAGEDDLRMSLKGVYLEIEAGKIICTATNTHVLSTIQSEADIAAGKAVIIPSATLRVLQGLPLTGDLSIAVSDNNIAIKCGDIEVHSRLIDEKYPAYQNVIPQSNSLELQVDNQEFTAAIKRVSQFGIKSTSQVILTTTETELTISAENVDFNEAAVEVIPCKFTGEPIAIGLSAKQLIACFSKAPTGSVRMTFSSPNRAALIYGGEGHVMLCMPYLIH